MFTRESATALAALTGINLLNYFTRYIPSANKDLIKHELGLTDFQTGFLFTSFITCYMLVSPAIGLIADRRLVPRKVLIVVGVLLWSVATSATGLCRSFGAMIVPRVLFGMGEAVFGTLGPALLCDFFAPQHRSVALSAFMVAIPVGAALGYGVAGALGEAIGWRRTFLLLGAPGLVSVALLLLREPVPGEMDAPEPASASPARQRPRSLLGEFWALVSNPNWAFATAGYVAVTFGMGGFSDWLPTLFVRYRGMSVAEAGTANGAIVVVAGLAGTVAGCYAGELLRRLGVRHALMAVSAVSMLASTACGFASLYLIGDGGWPAVVVLFSATVFFGWWYNGPINAILNNSVPPSLRSRSNGLCNLSIHLFGDSVSPSIIGAVSDATGGDLRSALTVVPAMLAVSAELWLIGWWLAPEMPSERQPATSDAPANTSLRSPVSQSASPVLEKDACGTLARRENTRAASIEDDDRGSLSP
eukprot:m51a1_g11617 hypothetical protein (475) ;mRNA; r:23937-25611